MRTIRCFLSAVLLCATPLLAQTRPALEVVPQVLGVDGQVTLSLPPGATLPTARVRVGLFEAGRTARVADVTRQLTLVNGRWQTGVQVVADPGNYEFRLLSSDRAATPLTSDAPSDALVVPGVERGPGFWIFNGASWVYSMQNAPSSPDWPLFLPNLKRDFGRKAKAPMATWRAPSGLYVPWRTVPLPTLREMLAPNYDFAALRIEVAQRVQEAQNGRQRGFAGFLLPSGNGAPLSANVANALAQLRPILDAAAPGAALIFEVDAIASPAQAARDLDFVAAQCDAVVIRANSMPECLWPIKVARKVAEEQPFFDLPVWVELDNATGGDIWLSDLMAGASGLILSGKSPGTNGESITPSFDAFLKRNASLWTGSVTLEDAGLAFPLEGVGTIEDESPILLYNRLRSIGRIPLLARTVLPEKGGSPEPFSLRLGERISNATAQRLESLVRAGAHIYLEGTPQLDEQGNAAPWRLEILVGASIAPLPLKSSAMTLDDAWTFGTGRGTSVPVEQSVTVTLKPPTMSSQAKTQKGTYAPVGSRTVAKLEDGSPAVIVNELGKGEVVWLPHRLKMSEGAVSPIPTAAAPGSAPAPTAPLTGEKLMPWQKFYAGIADAIAPRLVQLRAATVTDSGAQGAAGPEAVRVALRRSPKGALLVGLFNTAAREASVWATVEIAAKTALDLTTETEAPSSIRGGQTTFTVTLPPHGWKVVALAETRKDLDDERNAPRLKAKLR